MGKDLEQGKLVHREPSHGWFEVANPSWTENSKTTATAKKAANAFSHFCRIPHNILGKWCKGWIDHIRDPSKHAAIKHCGTRLRIVVKNFAPKALSVPRGWGSYCMHPHRNMDPYSVLAASEGTLR